MANILSEKFTVTSTKPFGFIALSAVDPRVPSENVTLFH